MLVKPNTKVLRKDGRYIKVETFVPNTKTRTTKKEACIVKEFKAVYIVR